jgi:hypothetical protein
MISKTKRENHKTTPFVKTKKKVQRKNKNDAKLF